MVREQVVGLYEQKALRYFAHNPGKENILLARVDIALQSFPLSVKGPIVGMYDAPTKAAHISRIWNEDARFYANAGCLLLTTQEKMGVENFNAEDYETTIVAAQKFDQIIANTHQIYLAAQSNGLNPENIYKPKVHNAIIEKTLPCNEFSEGYETLYLSRFKMLYGTHPGLWEKIEHLEQELIQGFLETQVRHIYGQ